MKHFKTGVLVFMDACAVNAALFFAFYLRFEGRIPLQYYQQWFVMALVITLIRLIFFIAFGLYRSLWLYTSLPELFQVVKAVTASTIAFWTLITVYPFIHLPRSIGVLTWVINIFLIGGIRLGIRLRREFIISRRKSRVNRRVLIVGAGYVGAMAARQMLHDTEYAMTPIAFADDDPTKQHRSIHGIPIAGKISDIRHMVSKYKPDEILIAIPSASRTKIREIVENIRKTQVPVRIIPDMLESAHSVVLKQIRNVRIEDLLGREPVRVDLTEVAGYLKGERVLVTGAGGSIGSELCRQIAEFQPEKLLILGRGENSIYEIDQELNFTYGSKLKKLPIIADIKDRAKMEQVFRDYQPSVVFHAAAHKHVPLMENAPEEAVKNNVFGTKNVAELSKKYGVKRFVLISTDKAVNPTNVMGATKRVAEMIVQNLARTSHRTKYCAVRFGNVLGSRGSVIPLFKKQIQRGGPVTITHPEMTRFFMTIPEAVSLVIQAGAMGEKGEVFILDMGEPVKIYDLAMELIRLSGFRPELDIPIAFTGIRPGEKLYEEILTEEEGTSATKHKRIYVGRPNGVNWEQLPEDLAFLDKWVTQADRYKVVEKLQQMVPKYEVSNRWQEEIAAGHYDG